MRRHAGFTLIELLVAIAIFTVVGVMALSGYNELVSQSERAADSSARIRKVQAAVFRISQDFAQLEPRPVREPLGDTMEPAMRAAVGTTQVALLTRSGWSNPAGVQRGTLQRVGYRLEDGKLFRDYWVVLDRTMTNEPVTVELVDRVRSATLRFMDQNRQWHDQWPPAGYTSTLLPNIRPIAVEITLELEDWGRIVRLVEVAG